MKILWIVNMVMPDLANELQIKTGASGTWLFDIAHLLVESKDVTFAIACVYGDKFRAFDIHGVRYYLLPGNGKNMLFYTKKYERIWKIICDEFKPDIVHLHGTEYSHGLSFLRACPDVKAIVSIQGILNRIRDVDFGGLPKHHFFFNRTLHQWIHFNGELEMHCIHNKNAKHEIEILNRVQYINGVNTWDISLCKSINPSLKAFKIDYNLRNEFYNSNKWNTDNMNEHTIFTNPGGTPLKGIHQLINAGALLKDKYPDLMIIVPGMGGTDGKLRVNSAYSKYISKLVKRLNMENHISFYGMQTANEMREKMLSSNVVVIPSAIEGTSLILREAMYIGCPCVASFRGGMADFISDKQDGFLYDFQEYPYLAQRLDKLFSNVELCEWLSSNAIKKASEAHDQKNNLEQYIKMYQIIIKEKSK